MDDNKVRVTVHRGAKQIGGCCTEISYRGTRIVVDFGSPLPQEDKKVLDIDGLTRGTSLFDGVLFTHYHGDHVGEIGRINSDIPVYIGGLAKDVATAYKAHNSYFYENADMDKTHELVAGKEIAIGSLQITPVLSDHSAAESFMFLIKADNFQILHTGDFRLHGRYGEELRTEVGKLGKIDLLITEGTTLSRNEEVTKNYTEEFTEERIREYVYNDKYCFMILSSTNFDRFQVISNSVDRYRKENKPKGKYFVVDEFQKTLFEIAEKRLPERYRFRTKTTYGANLDAGMEEKGFVMLLRPGHADHEKLLWKYLEKYPEQTILIYSMWSGYIKTGKLKELTDIAHEKNRLRIIHSSGHVTKQDMKEFIDVLSPEKVIVIHTEDAEQIDGLKNQILIENGKTLDFC